MQNTGYFFHFIIDNGDEYRWALVDSPVYRNSSYYKGDTFHGQVEPAYIGIMQPNGQIGYLPIIFLNRLNSPHRGLFIATDCYALPEYHKQYDYQAWLNSQLYINIVAGGASTTIQDANGFSYSYSSTYGVS